MPEPSSRLPARPSLEQLRKQARERLRQQRLTEPAATLAAAQFALAREYGFESWPRLVQHIRALHPSRVEQLEQIAAHILAGASGDANALERLIEHTGASYSPAQMRIRVEGWINDVAGPGRASNWTIDDARLTVARQYGFDTWEALKASIAEAARGAPAVPGRSAPPFYDIDRTTRTIELRPPLNEADWDLIADLVEEHGLTGLEANGQMTDAGLARISAIGQLTRLGLDGSKRLGDDGLQHLARMPQLEELDLSGWHMTFTDRGLEPLRQLHVLKVFKACWPQRISDQGIANLRECGRLEEVNLMGTPTGDGAVSALAGKGRLARLHAGKLLTDLGIRHLQGFPAFRTWQGGELRYGLMSPGAGPTYLMLDGPFTDAGFRQLAGLDGLFGLGLFWHISNLTPDGLGALSALPNLGMLGCEGRLCDDTAMAHVGAIPGLRMLMAQGTVASDEGFVALSRSETLEHLWGRDSGNLKGRGFRALAELPALKGLAVSCRGVADADLASLPSFPSLDAFVSIDLAETGFRHVGRCRLLERLWCMYCRDTGDRATDYLADLGRLRSYYAGKTRITDRSLEVLGGMESLEELEFWQTAGITDAGLRSIARLPRLRKVAIEGAAGITGEGVKVFPRAVQVRYRG
jgi:hypothetical protein